jgi:hypothetical protein
MSTVIVADETREQILATNGEIEFRDAAGNLLALGRKVVNYRELVAPEDWPSDEELDRISKMEGGHTIEQVMERLRGLSK